MNSHSTISQITTLLSQLSEGDRQRVLKFVSAIAQDRQEKKAKRRRRFERSGRQTDGGLGSSRINVLSEDSK